MRPIRSAARSEWGKLRRRSLLLGTLAGVAVVEVLNTVLTFATARSHVGPGGHSLGGALTLEKLASTHGLAAAFSLSAELLGVVAFSVAAAQLAMEYSHGTLRNLFVRQPRRLVVLLGKLLALACFTVLAVVVAALVATAVAAVMATVRGIPLGAWFQFAGLGAMATTIGNVSLAAVGYATLGVVLGILFRSPVSAIAVGLAFLLPVEAILSSSSSSTARYLPGQLLDAVAQGGTTVVSYTWALLGAAIVVVLLAVVSGRLFVRRDLTT
jgi:ABC-type transport system involved in multi-copper enzyme maturation permease subunit